MITYRVPRPWVIRVQTGDIVEGYMTAFGTINTPQHAQQYTQAEGLPVCERLKQMAPDRRFILTSELSEP